MRHIFFFLILILFLSSVAYAGRELVTDSQNRHNLSMYSAYSIKAVNERQICIFCHTPHNAMSNAPLWNHEITAATYTHYWSATMNAYSSEASAPPIDGYSRLCLSCHDGTVALGAVRARITTYGEGTTGEGTTTIWMNTVSGIVDASGKLLAGAAGYLGTDLSGHHPVSFEFDDALAGADGELFYPSTFTDTDVKLYPTGSGNGVQCTSCHDPHNDSTDDTFPFWRKTTFSDVCVVCHNM